MHAIQLAWLQTLKAIVALRIGVSRAEHDAVFIEQVNFHAAEQRVPFVVNAILVRVSPDVAADARWQLSQKSLRTAFAPDPSAICEIKSVELETPTAEPQGATSPGNIRPVDVATP